MSGPRSITGTTRSGWAARGRVLPFYLAAWTLLALMGFLWSTPAVAADQSTREALAETIRFLSDLGDRTTGTPGARAAADYIHRQLTALDVGRTGRVAFSLPTIQYGQSTLAIPGRGEPLNIHPFHYNAVTPGQIAKPGLTGPLVYVGLGREVDFNGKDIFGSIVLMELDSGKNWQQAAALGAKALIYLRRGPTPRAFYSEKRELTPLDFPCFWMTVERAREVFGAFENAPQGLVLDEVTLNSDAVWKKTRAENIFCFIPGSDPDLNDKAIIVEAFYDSTAYVPGLSPGADEALSVATLLDLAGYFKDHPPGRAVLLVATAGHAQTLSGWRETVWCLRERSRSLRQLKKELADLVKISEQTIAALVKYMEARPLDEEEEKLIRSAIAERIKTEVDIISRRLMRLRLEQRSEEDKRVIKELADRRMVLSQLGWLSDFNDLKPEEVKTLEELAPLAREDVERILEDVQGQLDELDAALKFRRVLDGRDVSAVISLHLSSHGDGLGAFNQGFLHELRPSINRVEPYSRLVEVLNEAAEEYSRTVENYFPYIDTLRPNRLRTWKSWFLDHPPLGGEISALAGYLGFTLATLEDARPTWGTPDDVFEQVDLDRAARQSDLVRRLAEVVSGEPKLETSRPVAAGLSTVTGRANFIRHGELFPDQPAPGTVILAYQGPGYYYTMVDATGTFRLKGVTNKKHVMDKVIIEGYRFDSETGQVIWAIDKKQTGLDAYRVKMTRRAMQTDLVMFACRQTTLFNLLEPRSFRYMTKLQLLDGRLEAPPRRYWYSRIDTRSSIITSIYLEPGTRLKMTLSDTVLRKKMILLNSTPSDPSGAGYLIDDNPVLYRTEWLVARDMWDLLGPRVNNLERHGIFNAKIRELQDEGAAAFRAAEEAYKNKQYDQAAEAAVRSWALASRVYDHVEKTQKDVLFGVFSISPCSCLLPSAPNGSSSPLWTFTNGSSLSWSSCLS